MKRLIAIAGLVMVAGGCGALFNSGPEQVTVQSNPAGAEVIINGQPRGTTPLQVDLPKNANHTIVLRKAGYQEMTTTLNRKVSGTYVILDVLGGLIPIIIDAATGSWYVLSDDEVNVTLAPVNAMGTLTPEQVAAVKAGARAEQFIDVAQVVSSLAFPAQK